MTATSLSPVDSTSSRSQQSDLIEISVTSDTPAKAAAIANAWAKHYVDSVNSIYGQVPPEILDSVQSEMTKANDRYTKAEQAYEVFVATDNSSTLRRQLSEKQNVIASLQGAKQMAFTRIVSSALAARGEIILAYINAQSKNRLLTFQKEQEANKALVGQLIDAETENRQMAVQMDRQARTELFKQYVQALIDNRLAALKKDQDARAQLFSQYADAEIQNRLAALTQEQTAKSKIFDAFSAADLDAKLAVFNDQVQSRIQKLTTSYSTKLKLEKLLSDAQGLQSQVSQAGVSSARSNSLAILLLKAQAYASGADVPANFQLQLSGVGDLDVDPQHQAADLAALVETLQTRITDLDKTISDQSTTLFNNENYQLLDKSRPADDQLYAAIRQKYLDLFNVGDLAKAANGIVDNSELSKAILAKYNELFGVGTLPAEASDNWQVSDLSRAITAKYNELFGVGPLATASLVLSDTTPMYQAISAQYPQLFQIGDLSQLTDAISNTSPLDEVTAKKIQDILQLQGLQNFPGYSSATDPASNSIDQLEKEVQTLQAQLAKQESQRKQLVQERDLSWSSFSTLQSKIVELTLQRTAGNREVRMGAPAIAPDKPDKSFSLVTSTAIAGILGFMLSVFIAFVAHYLGREPFLSDLRHRTA